MISPYGDCIYVGIGCFYFATESDKLDAWAEGVRSLLARVPSISEFQVEGDGSNGYVLIGGKAVPIDGRVSFKIKIPMAVQETYMGGLAIDLEIENFEIDTFYEWHGPVTYVVSAAASDPLVDASDHVVVVREYLKKQLLQSTGGVTFHILGPSPFHADISLTLARQSTQFSSTRTRSEMYDKFEFTAASKLYANVEEAVPDFLHRLSGELSLFYKLVAAYGRRLHAFVEIEHYTKKLLAVYQDTGVRVWLARIFTSSSQMRRLALAAITEQYDNQAESNRSHREIDELYASHGKLYFKDYLMQQASKNFSDNVSAAREIASLLDQARGRQIETLSLFLSALAGGLAGALVSLFVR